MKTTLKDYKNLFKPIFEIDNRLFIFNICSLDNCIFSRRYGYRGIRLFRYSLYFKFKFQYKNLNK